MTVLNLRNLCSMLNKNMKIPKTPNFSKLYQNITTFKCLKRFPSIVPTVQSGITGFVTMISWLPRVSLQLVNSLYDGLKKLSISILTKFFLLKKLTTLLHQIRIAYILLLTNLFLQCLKREQKLQKLSTSWTRLQKRSWNLLLMKVSRLLLS